MKKIILTLAGIFAILQLHAQVDTLFTPAAYDPAFLANMEDTCECPQLLVAPVVHYADDVVVFLEFSNYVEQVQLINMTSGQILVTWVGGTNYLFQHIVPDSEYEVYVMNTCNEFELIGSFNSLSGKHNTISVSDRLYNALRDFQYQEEGQAIPLGQFLEERDDVAFFEKASFLQQYFLKGDAIQVFSESTLPGPREEWECDCEFVFNLSQVAVPGNLVNGTIYSKTELQPKLPMSGNDYNAAWWNRNTKGAAKWHQLWTEGSKAGSQDHTYTMKMADSSATYGTQYGQLRYNNLCTNYLQLPYNCQCNKPLYLYWRYDSEVCAHAERHTEGWGSKNAVAAAEDIGVVVLRRDGTNLPHVLDAGSAQASAECSRSLNPDFWVNTADLAFNIAVVSVGISNDDQGGQNPGQQQFLEQSSNTITQKLDVLLNTPFYSDNFCDSDNCVEQTLCFGDTLVYLKANEPINLYLFSNSALMAGGKRSWFSWSRVLSDFYLTGYVPGGIALENQVHCCSQKYANWVYASESGAPHSTTELALEVGTILSAWAPWPVSTDPYSGIVNIPYEYFSMGIEVVDCDGDGFSQAIDRDGKTEIVADNNSIYDLYIFDISGRLLFHEKEHAMNFNLNELIREKIPAAPTGIYLIQVHSGEGKTYHKIFYTGNP